MQPVEFKYYLRKYNGSNYNWYYVDASGGFNTQHWVLP